MLIIRNISYLVRSPDCIEQNCDVAIDGNQILSIQRGIPGTAGDEEINASGCAVIPGLINAHTHLYQNFLKGVSAGIELVPWCNEVLFPTVGAIQLEAQKGNYRPAYLWSMAAAVEMIRGGTTCCLDMDHIMPQTPQAWQEIGLRGVVGYTLTNMWVPAELRGDEEAMRRKVLAYIQQWHQPDGLTQVFLAPSTPFLCDDNLLKWSRDCAEDLDLGIQIHVSEIAGEVSDSLRDFQMTPVERLDRLGLINPRVSAVHLVHVNSSEIQRLAAGQVTAVHCPKSNMKLADGIAPVPAMKAAGIPVSLGTDGCGSNDLLDMWEEMRSAVLLGRVGSMNAAALNAADAFRMATVDAARACRLKAGQIKPGYLADLAVVELKDAGLRPLHADRLLNMLVFCGRACDVRDTVINGKVVMRNRRLTTVDEAEILREADEVEAPLYRARQDYHFNP